MADDLPGHPAAARLEADAVQRLLEEAAAAVGLTGALRRSHERYLVEALDAVLEQFQEKCETVFRPELRQNKEIERFCVSVKQ